MDQSYGFFMPFIITAFVLIGIAIAVKRFILLPKKLQKQSELAERAAFFRSPQGNTSGGLDAAMMDKINQQRKTDPLIGARLGSKELTVRLMRAMGVAQDGIHVEALLATVAAYAGYSCQASLRAELIDDKGQTEQSVFAIMQGKDGKKYYFGSPLNKAVAESPNSIWSMAAGAAQQNGATAQVDVIEIFKYVAASIGGPAFGVPRIPAGHSIGDAALIDHVKHWPALLPLLNQYCASPSEWPALFGYALQDIIIHSKGMIDPDVALTIVMECAIPMSKVDLTTA